MGRQRINTGTLNQVTGQLFCFFLCFNGATTPTNVASGQSFYATIRSRETKPSQPHQPTHEGKLRPMLESMDKPMEVEEPRKSLRSMTPLTATSRMLIRQV